MLSNSSSSSVSSVLNHLPADLLSDKEVFLNLLTDGSIWQGLSQAKQQELKDKYLPSDFTQNDKEDTIHLLFKRSLSRFNRDALDEVFAKLKLQKMTPEIIRAIEEVKLMKQRLSKLYEQKRQCHLLNEVLEQRYSLMKSSLSLSIDGVIKSKTFYFIIENVKPISECLFPCPFIALTQTNIAVQTADLKIVSFQYLNVSSSYLLFIYPHFNVSNESTKQFKIPFQFSFSPE